MTHLKDDTARQRLTPAWLISGAVAAVSAVLCLALAVGWTVHCNRLRAANDRLTGANEELNKTNQLLDAQLTTVIDQAGQTVDELMAANRMLANATEKLAAEMVNVRRGLETSAAENPKLVDAIAQVQDNAQKQIDELTQTIAKLTEDASAAAALHKDLVARLQAKTDEAAEQAIRINTLVEMVARLRVLVGLTGQQPDVGPTEAPTPADPNAAEPVPPA